MSLIVLLFLAMAVVIMPATLSFQPFDYRKVAYRSGLLLVVAMILVPPMAALEEGDLSPLRLQSVLELMGLMLVFALLGTLTAYVNFRGMRRLSEGYAMREAALDEKRRKQPETDDEQASTLNSERG